MKKLLLLVLALFSVAAHAVEAEQLPGAITLYCNADQGNTLAVHRLVIGNKGHVVKLKLATGKGYSNAETFYFSSEKEFKGGAISTILTTSSIGDNPESPHDVMLIVSNNEKISFETWHNEGSAKHTDSKSYSCSIMNEGEY